MCIPGLHISLGIFDRLWGLLEDACIELDLHIVRHKEAMDGNTFGQYSGALDDVVRLRKKMEVQQQHSSVLRDMISFLMLHLPDPANDPTLKQAMKQVSDHERAITSTVGSRNAF